MPKKSKLNPGIQIITDQAWAVAHDRAAPKSALARTTFRGRQQERLAYDTERFLRAGGKVQVVPRGLSGDKQR